MRLTVETGPLAGTQVALDRHHPTTLGSARECALCIAEPGVAPEHAVVKALRDEGFGVKALAPGLRLNGREIEAAPLTEGDVLEIGTTRVTYGSARAHKGPQITGFKILGELGKGGMGIVYRAEQVSLHREVALKVLDKKLTDNPQFVARFVAEARAAAKLSHPNVVHVFDVDQDGNTYFYAMELMHHGSLEAWLKKNGKMPVERALQVVADAAAGLAYAESLGIVHRDIKPDNLMLDQHGTVKIADLGLAFTEDSGEEHVAGTPHFMAPEQVLRKGLDHRTDLYALGCTFYRLVTGKTPFRGQTVKDILRAHVRDQAEPANKVESSVPADVAAIIQKLMAKEPGDRYQSATELVEAVQQLLQPPARKGLWIGLAAAGVLIAGGAIYWAVNKPKEVVEIERKYDDPEKQMFADQLKELRAERKEDKALIALLRARLDGATGLDLAHALDAIATEHAGTKAAVEAQQLAGRTRAAIADQEAQRQHQTQLAAEAVAAARTQVDTALAAGDLPRALAQIGAVATPPGADADEVKRGLAEQRQRVLDRAHATVAGLCQRIDAAKAGGNAEAMRTACAELGRMVRAGGWPDELVENRAAVVAQLDAAEKAAGELESAAAAAEWQAWSTLLNGADGIATQLQRADFGAATARLRAHAEQHPGTAPAARATALADALQQAAGFGDALQAAAERSELQLPSSTDDTTAAVARWLRNDGQIVILDAAKKPAKEQTLPIGDLKFEQWQALCGQVTEPAAGSRAAFLAFVTLQQHIAAARAYLADLKTADDDSGTGAHGYPLGFTLLDQLQQQVPDAPWAAGLRQELQAGQLLAQGLRALSERRNLAAAGYLDRLCADHPHSLCVAALP